MFSSQITGLNFTTEMVQFETVNPVRAAFVDYVRVGTLGIAYYAIIDFALENNAGSTRWTAKRITPGRARMLGGGPIEFTAFVEDAKAAAATRISFVYRSPDEIPRLASYPTQMS